MKLSSLSVGKSGTVHAKYKYLMVQIIIMISFIIDINTVCTIKESPKCMLTIEHTRPKTETKYVTYKQ